MNTDLISIVIPVFNVEKYLDSCLKSIICQTYTNLEILIINDGSKDSSGEICEKYASNDQRIKVFHQKNNGLSAARNRGIALAKGKYISFVDSDDTIESSYISTLYDLMIKYDTQIAVGAIAIVNNNKRRNNRTEKIEVLDTKECISRMYLDDGISVSANAKLYLTSLFKGIIYPVGKLYEDNATTYKLILKCERIVVTNKIIYSYFIRKNSITNRKFSIAKMDYISNTDEACDEILTLYPDLKEVCMYRKAIARLSILRQILNSERGKEQKKIETMLEIFFKQNYNLLRKNKYAGKKLKISLFLLKINKNLLKIGGNIYEKLKI